MKTNFFKPGKIGGRVAIGAMLVLIVWSCSTSKTIPDRLLGADLVELEQLLVRQVERGNRALTNRLAEVFFLQGKYHDAFEHYQQSDALGQLTSPHHRRNFVHAGKVLGFSTRFDRDTGYFDRTIVFPVKINPFCGNSRNEDIVPYQWGEYLFVTSSRQQSEENYPITGKPFLNIVAFVENCQTVALPDFLPPNLNTDLHDGPLAISKDGNLVIINRNYRRPNRENYRHLYFDYYIKDSQGRWSDAVRVPFSHVDYSVQHPFFNDKEQALYYSSDKPGGKGGFDLYKSVWDGSNWGAPENLGSEINAIYDEVFPVFTPEGYLMYSSNHPETLGGLDFVLFKDGKRMLFPAPLNTVYDDFALTFSSATSGYFSSTRDRGPFTDNIFQFTVHDPICKDFFVKVHNKKTGLPIDGVLVRYNALEVPRREQLVTVDGGQSFMFCNPSGLKWPVEFQAEKQGYLPLSVFKGFEYLPDRGIYLAILELEIIEEALPQPPPHISSGNIVVFFENDIPRPATFIPPYDITYQRYLEVRGEYFRGSINPRTEMERFFAEVDHGMSNLMDFASYVFENIGENKLEIFLKGHASPRSNPVYNAALSGRRNQSIKNYLLNWNGGKLAPFLANGQIRIVAIPFGDTQAPRGVDASFQDRARSVYSVEASRERRVTLFWHWVRPAVRTSQITESIRQIASLKREQESNAVLEKTNVSSAYIIVGSFPNLIKARTMVEDLVSRGYNTAGVIPGSAGINHRVFVGKFDSREKAAVALRTIRREITDDAWVLVE